MAFLNTLKILSCIHCPVSRKTFKLGQAACYTLAFASVKDVDVRLQQTKVTQCLIKIITSMHPIKATSLGK